MSIGSWGQGRARGMLYYVLGSPPPLWDQGMRGQVRESWEQARSKGTQLGARGASLEQGE